ncbi:MAG: bestrophin-like domain [Ilumatobacteraceae bacterium]
MLHWLAPIIVVVVVAVAVTAKLLVRRRAPVGGWFTDAPRSAGSLSVIGTMFAVMLAFVILFSLQSYQRAREGSSVEAVAITELDAVAQVFPTPTSDRLRGDLVCYGRAVINDEWPAMQDGHSSALVESWVDRMHDGFAAANPSEARQEAAYAQWFDEEARRREGRRERLAEATPFMPVPLWFALGIGASLTLAYMVVQADRREGMIIQAIPIGFVAALVSAGLLVVVFLDNPYTGGSGSIEPTEMSRTLTRIDRGVHIPCDERGHPT